MPAREEANEGQASPENHSQTSRRLYLEVEENFPRRAGDGRLAAPMNGMTPTTEPAATDTGITTVSTDGPRDPALQVDRSTGRMTIAVHGAELPSTDTEGWQVTGKGIRQCTTSTTTSEPGATCKEPVTNHTAYARRVAARITKAARMPHTLPREDNKIVLRPRGGLNIARTEASTLMSAIFAAADISLHESKEDTICTNVAQNILVVSTPDEARAKRYYASARHLCIGGREYEVSAYRSAPSGTARGIIRGIAVTDTYEDLQANIVNEANPLALEAH